MNANQIIEQARYITAKMYIDAPLEDQQFFHIQQLEAKIRELCHHLVCANQEIRTLQNELRNFND